MQASFQRFFCVAKALYEGELWIQAYTTNRRRSRRDTRHHRAAIELTGRQEVDDVVEIADTHLFHMLVHHLRYNQIAF